MDERWEMKDEMRGDEECVLIQFSYNLIISQSTSSLTYNQPSHRSGTKMLESVGTLYSMAPEVIEG